MFVTGNNGSWANVGRSSFNESEWERPACHSIDNSPAIDWLSSAIDRLYRVDDSRELWQHSCYQPPVEHVLLSVSCAFIFLQLVNQIFTFRGHLQLLEICWNFDNASIVWVKPPPPLKFSDVWEFLAQILYAYYTFISTLGVQIFIQLTATLTKLCHIKRDHHNVLKMSTIDRNARWMVALNMA